MFIVYYVAHLFFTFLLRASMSCAQVTPNLYQILLLNWTNKTNLYLLDCIACPIFIKSAIYFIENLCNRGFIDEIS